MDAGSIEYDVVWPRHRRDYLCVEEEEPVLMRVAPPVVDDPSPAPPAPTSGRALAARALLGAGCTHARAGALLGTSRRSIGRTVDLDVPAALRNPETLTGVRGCLVESERRGSTAEERDAALDWLGRALHDPPGDRSPAERPAHQAASSGPTDEASQPG